MFSSSNALLGCFFWIYDPNSGISKSIETFKRRPDACSANGTVVVVHPEIRPLMNIVNDLDHCMCCPEPIDYREYTYTMDSFGIAMCSSCTRNYLSKLPQSEPLERILYAALLNKGIKGAELQYFDGFKTVDIAILSARLHIEIDGSHHTQANQGATDLWRSDYSLKRGDVLTLRIPNAVVLEDVESAATLITKVISLRQSAA